MCARTIDQDECELDELRVWHKVQRDNTSQHWLDVDTCLAVVDDAQRRLDDELKQAADEARDREKDIEDKYIQRIENLEAELDVTMLRADDAEAELFKLRELTREARDTTLPMERRRLVAKQLFNRLR